MSITTMEVQGFRELKKPGNFFDLDFVDNKITIEERNWKRYGTYKIDLKNAISLTAGRTIYSNKIKNRYLKGAIVTGVLFFLVDFLFNGKVAEALRWGGVGFAVSLIYKFLFKRNRPQRKYIHPIMAIDYIEDETKELKTITIVHHQSSLQEALAFKKQTEEALSRTERLPEALAIEREIREKREQEMKEREDEIQECIRLGETKEPDMMRLELFNMI